jgi:galactokinase
MPHYAIPGRIELVGKHVDYAGGRSLTFATDLSLAVAATPRRDSVVSVRSAAHSDTVEVALDARAGDPRSAWGCYVAAVTRRIARDFPDFRTGVHIDVESNLPQSAGLSSSSALTVGVAMAILDANAAYESAEWMQLLSDPCALAEYFGAMETGAPFGPFAGDQGVGVFGGAQDHVAIVCAREAYCGVFKYRPAQLEQFVPWPKGYVIAVGVSGAEATKTGNARDQYNRTANSTRALLAAWNVGQAREDGSLADALASHPHAADGLRALAARGVGEFTGAYLGPRLEQFMCEIDEIVPGVADALGRGDFERLGSLTDRSQHLAETALLNQVEETIALQRIAREEGAVASSAFGAGFGGAVWAMIKEDDSERFTSVWSARYRSRHPHRTGASQFHLTQPASAARRIDTPAR